MASVSPIARTVRLADGIDCPAFGMGTWRMGEQKATRAAEIAALQAGLDAGVKLIDTAEMYGEGEAETIVAAAMAGRRWRTGPGCMCRTGGARAEYCLFW